MLSLCLIIKHYLKYLIITFCLVPFISYAATSKPLPMAQAFQLTATLDANNIITAHWKIAPGYYLYKDKFSFTVLNSTQVELSKPVLPAGTLHEDSVFGNYEIYLNPLAISLAIVKANITQTTIAIGYQGCSSEGFCYPPTTANIPLTLNRVETTGLDRLLDSHNFLLISLGFFVLGILLAFTPCVFPMLPILSSIIVGQNQPLTTSKAFKLSLSYVLSMAITYAFAGLLMGFAGSNIQSALQNPWVIAGFSGLLVLLALSLFGCYELQLPATLRDRLQRVNQRQQGGTYVSVAIMGFISTLIVSPCVSAPLVGALSYISQQGNPWLGVSTLFALGLGMGLPLLVVGTFGGSFLPKVGAWMNAIKTLFGISLLFMALWMLERIIPTTLTIWLWSLLFTSAAIALGALEPATTGWQRLWKSGCFLLLCYGVLISLSAMQGNSNPWKITLAHHSPTVQNSLPFKKVTQLADVQQALKDAKQQHKKVLLDFYADWCISCKKMDQSVFSDAQVKAALADSVLLRADITVSNAANKQLTQAFNVIAPPTILLFDSEGQELKTQRIIGEIDTNNFLKQLNSH